MSTALHFPPEPFAPWAEIVPGYGPVAVDILLTLPDDGYRYKVVEGVLVRMAGSGFDATTLGLELGAELRNDVRPRRLGRVTGADGVYKFPGAETGLLPDVGFIEASKVALITDRRKPIPFAPDLAVEVASPDQKPDDMAAKARTYLDGARAWCGSYGPTANRSTCGAPAARSGQPWRFTRTTPSTVKT